MFTFAEVCLVIALADASSLGVADTMLSTIESNEVVRLSAPAIRGASSDIALHDSLVDTDPMFLEWDSVQRTRSGQAWSCFAAGVDTLPVAS